MIALVLALAAAEPLVVDGEIEHLATGSPRAQLASAAWALADGPTVELAGVVLRPQDLARWSTLPVGVDVQDAVRADLGRAVDLPDLLLLLDDVVDRDGEEVVIPAGRARSAGLLVHPREVFAGTPRDLAGRQLATDRPQPQQWVPPAEDHAPLGVRWTTRFANPESTAARLDALTMERGDPAFAEQIAWMGAQLEAQGAQVWVTSTARDPRRGYLLWGSFILSRQTSAAGVSRTVALLNDRNAAWSLDVPIEWEHPDGWQETVRHAMAMAETYDVVYATERGARSSNHYGGNAVDLVGLNLPAQLTLVAPDGEAATFDMRGPDSTHDLSLEVPVIEWIEAHFGWSKLTGDYPHWSYATR